MKYTARQAAARIREVFNKHWSAFKAELAETPEWKGCRDKGLAWSMATADISLFVHNLKGKA